MASSILKSSIYDPVIPLLTHALEKIGTWMVNTVFTVV